jgi:hypothetical protein
MFGIVPSDEEGMKELRKIAAPQIERMIRLAEEFKADGIAVNALWPKTVIATAALQALPGGTLLTQGARRPEIMADAAYAILTRKSRECTGRFFIDEEVLAEAGVSYAGPAAGARGRLAAEIVNTRLKNTHKIKSPLRVDLIGAGSLFATAGKTHNESEDVRLHVALPMMSPIPQ